MEYIPVWPKHLSTSPHLATQGAKGKFVNDITKLVIGKLCSAWCWVKRKDHKNETVYVPVRRNYKVDSMLASTWKQLNAITRPWILEPVQIHLQERLSTWDRATCHSTTKNYMKKHKWKSTTSKRTDSSSCSRRIQKGAGHILCRRQVLHLDDTWLWLLWKTCRSYQPTLTYSRAWWRDHRPYRVETIDPHAKCTADAYWTGVCRTDEMC